MTTGIFNLKTPKDLLEKLRHDLERVRRNRMDQYAAFDFFVTAEHMIDWLHPDADGKEARKKLRESNPLLALCSHLASDSKHFEATAKHHKSVSESHVHNGELSDEFSDEFNISGLLITLSGEAQKSLGEVIHAHSLAEKVFSFWETYIADLNNH